MNDGDTKSWHALKKMFHRYIYYVNQYSTYLSAFFLSRPFMPLPTIVGESIMFFIRPSVRPLTHNFAWHDFFSISGGISMKLGTHIQHAKIWHMVFKVRCQRSRSRLGRKNSGNFTTTYNKCQYLSGKEESAMLLSAFKNRLRAGLV